MQRRHSLPRAAIALVCLSALCTMGMGPGCNPIFEVEPNNDNPEADANNAHSWFEQKSQGFVGTVKRQTDVEDIWIIRKDRPAGDVHVEVGARGEGESCVAVTVQKCTTVTADWQSCPASKRVLAYPQPFLATCGLSPTTENTFHLGQDHLMRVSVLRDLQMSGTFADRPYYVRADDLNP